MIDVATGWVLWRHQASNIFYAAALGNRILTNTGQLYDRDGKQLLSPPRSTAGWVRTGALLLLSQPDATGTGADVEVAAVSATDGARMPLGRIPAIAGSCSWSTMVLVCPTSEGFKTWRFATK